MKQKYYYQTKCNLQVIPNPNSTYGTTTGSGKYEKGTTVSISAIPNTGYKFLQWREGESIANPRNVVVNGDSTYNALFYKESTGELKIVDTDLNLYSYNEYDALTTKPSIIGVAMQDGNDWLVYYKNYVGINGDGITGYRLGSDKSLPSDIFAPLSVADLMYPHSGKNSSDIFKNEYGNGYAAYIVGQLTDGGLSWYIPNLYEYTQIFNRTLDSSINAHDGFDSHFTLIQCPQIIKSSVINDHAHWSCDVGYGDGATKGKINPYRVTFLNTTNQPAYCTSGNYTYADNYNYVRPVARFQS